ncbi:hypothetical protein H1D32_16645 [Anaerobacillus sp. CMMVII]|uniref:hypothetical protein n=1 Tax=Anaerobacillus sp. CMMVII TaxID=2755588 RepID=UPI0021B8272E|nr:hypothetical protein [Anaerobacillus sp. CMMVII]MCT8139189.1 hypothetical protein [Anaerobacillus sp. CMMVII]
MKKQPDRNLQEILRLLGLQSDTKVRCLLESLIDDSRLLPGLENNLNIESLLRFDRDKASPNFIDLDNLRCIRKQIEEKIEALIEKLVCLLERLRKQRKLCKDLRKHDPLERKRLLKLVITLINLINLRSLIDRLVSLGE